MSRGHKKIGQAVVVVGIALSIPVRCIGVGGLLILGYFPATSRQMEQQATRLPWGATSPRGLRTEAPSVAMSSN